MPISACFIILENWNWFSKHQIVGVYRKVTDLTIPEPSRNLTDAGQKPFNWVVLWLRRRTGLKMRRGIILHAFHTIPKSCVQLWIFTHTSVDWFLSPAFETSFALTVGGEVPCWCPGGSVYYGVLRIGLPHELHNPQAHSSLTRITSQVYFSNLRNDGWRSRRFP